MLKTELAWTCGSQLEYVCLEKVSIRKTGFFGVWDNSSLMVLVHLGVGLGNYCSLKSWGDSPTDNEEFEVPTSKTLWFFCWFSSLFRDCTSYGVSLNANWTSFEFSKNACITISIYEKMLVVQFQYIKKCSSYNFHIW